MDDEPRQTYRDVWTFNYRGTALRKQAQALYEREAAAADKWDQEFQSAEKALSAAGVVTKEVQVTGGTQYQVQMDPEKQQAVSHARARMDLHRKKADEFERWAHLFDAEAEKTFALTVKDAEYFEL